MTGRLTISLSALAANYNALCRLAQGDVAAVVKADGYGLGAEPIAHRLAAEGCREFFVASCAEGVVLREALGPVVIYVLEGALPETVQQLLQCELIPVLNTPAQIETWSQTSAVCAVHVDTGMQRLGLPWADAMQVLAETSLKLELLISHFARADEPDSSATREQMARIQPVFEAMRAHYPELRLSLGNSAALKRGLGPEHLGRAGIGLYGGNPFHHGRSSQRPVARLEGRILQVRNVAPGQAVGYGGRFIPAKPVRLATVGIGYADGVPRLLSGRGRVFIGGQHRPIVGRVSMDMIHVNLGDLPAAEGDWVEVMGANVSVDEVAEHAQTIAYEVLTGLGRRPLRQYVEAEL